MPQQARDRWDGLHALRGWTRFESIDELEEAKQTVKNERLGDDPIYRSRLYFPIAGLDQPGVEPLTEAQAEEYGRLNMLLHEKMTRAATAQFNDTPLPPGFEENGGNPDTAWIMGTPFTYQNHDWYCASYECYIGVLTEYASSDLFKAFQELLRDEHANWCIAVFASDDFDFIGTDDAELYLFSNQALVTSDTLASFGIR